MPQEGIVRVPLDAVQEVKGGVVQLHLRQGQAGGNRRHAAQRQRGVQAHARGFARHHAVHGAGGGHARFGVADDFDELGLDLGIRLRRQALMQQRLRHLAVPQADARAPDGMHARQQRRARVRRDGEQRVPLASFRQFELRAHAHPAVGMTEQLLQIGVRARAKSRGDDLHRLPARGSVLVRRRVERPDAAFLIQRIAPVPVGEVKRALHAPGHADAHDAVVDGARVRHLECRAVRLQLERVHPAGGELVEQEMPAQGRAQRRARLVQEAGGAVAVIGQRRRDEQRLFAAAAFPRLLRQPDVLQDPAARALHVLMAAAPAGVALIRDVNQPLALAGQVRVVVHAKHVAEVVEGDLLHIAQAAGEDLEARPVRLHAQHRALVRQVEFLPLLAGHAHALVADAPVDAPVRPQARPVHVMARVGDVHAEAVRHHLPHIRHTVVVRVLQPPEVRRAGQVNPAVMIKDARRDARDLRVKTLREDRHLVRQAVAVRVPQLVNALAVNRQVLPVNAAVLVVILETAARQAQPAGGQLALQELPLLLHRRQAHIISDPHRMLADVQIRRLAPCRRRHIDAAVFIHRAGHRVRHIQSPGPLARHHLGGGGLHQDT